MIRRFPSSRAHAGIASTHLNIIQTNPAWHQNKPEMVRADTNLAYEWHATHNARLIAAQGQ